MPAASTAGHGGMHCGPALRLAMARACMPLPFFFSFFYTLCEDGQVPACMCYTCAKLGTEQRACGGHMQPPLADTLLRLCRFVPGSKSGAAAGQGFALEDCNDARKRRALTGQAEPASCAASHAHLTWPASRAALQALAPAWAPAPACTSTRLIMLRLCMCLPAPSMHHQLDPPPRPPTAPNSNQTRQAHMHACNSNCITQRDKGGTPENSVRAQARGKAS